jgi:hypothetical protein
MRLSFFALAFAFLVAAGRPAWAQRVALDSIATADTSLRHEARLRDGSRLVGRVVAVSADSVRIQLRSGPVSVARGEIAEIRQFSAANFHDGEYWADNSNYTRLLFSATAYPLARGDGYYWNAWLFLHGFAVGVSDRFTIGGGGLLYPGMDFGETFYFITPKITLTRGSGTQFAVGALAGFVPGIGGSSGDGASLGILYGVSSFGTRESNLSVGLGWGYVDSDIANRPIIMVGGQTRVSRRMAFVSENWFVPTGGSYEEGIISYGVRFLGEKLSVDLAFLNSAQDPNFPGFPWLGFSVKF